MKLTTNEKSDLSKLKKVVTENEKAFVSAGNALAEIQERKLYREESLTFELFCLKNWNWKKTHVYRMIQAASVVKTSPIGGQIPNERIARVLAKVPPEQHKAVMKAAAAEGPATAKSVEKAATPKPDIILDRLGIPVPAKATPFWNRREEVQAILTKVSAIKASLKHAQDTKDLLFTEVNFSSVLAYLDNMFGGIKRAMPHTVCPTCNGKLVESCTLCAGRGVISEILYERVDEDVKKMRSKSGGKK